MKQFKKLLRNPFVLNWVLTLSAFILFLFISFMIYTYTNSERSLHQEFTSYSELQTERIAISLDDSFNNYNQVIALLSLNDMTRIFLFEKNAKKIFPDISNQVYSQLFSYTQGFPAIDSIYLYPDSGAEVLSSTGLLSIAAFTSQDRNCLPLLTSSTERGIYPRKKNELYPYLFTYIFPLTKSSSRGCIALNVNLSRIPLLYDGIDDSFQSIYIVSDEGEILYRNEQTDIPEPLDIEERLQHFDSARPAYSKYVDEANPYIYVQQHSEQYPWYYITITSVQSYAGRPYNIFTPIFNFLPWLVAFAIFMIFWLARLATHPIRTISDFLEDPLSGMPEHISEPETGRLIQQFVNYVNTNKTLSEKLNQQIRLQNEATFAALQAQINPHFLFNTLNLIRDIEIETLGYDHEAPKLTLDLSQILRYAIDSTELVPLKTEIHYVKIYLNILNQRYKNRMCFAVECEPAVSDILIPKLILQALTENAVFHGCSPKAEEGHISIEAKLQKKRCVIVVEDDGVGMTPQQLEKLNQELADLKNIPSDSIGLKNAAFRMYLTYGDDFELSIASAPGQGTRITFSLPQYSGSRRPSLPE